MRRFTTTIALALVAAIGMQVMAQSVTLRGIYQTSRDDDYPNGYYSEYVGWNYALQKAIFLVQQGVYKMQWDGSTLSMPVKDCTTNLANTHPRTLHSRKS